MRDRSDHYSLRAQKEGYPARSVYKLEEIQRKHRLINRKDHVLDIGAAPGSWSLFAVRQLKALVWAVDLKPLQLNKTQPELQFLQGDVFSSEIQDQLDRVGPFDCLISDAAPATSGNRTIDTARSFQLVQGIMGMCSNHLKEGGNFCAKVFQGGDERQLLEDLKTQFRIARFTKPRACRKESFETFLVGIDYSGTG